VTGEPVLAGIDVGTTNTKVGMYRLSGTRLAARAWPTPADADKLVTAVLDGLASLVDRAGRPPDAVGVAGMAETGVTVAPDLTPLHPLIPWRDPRGAGGVERIRAEVGAAELFAITGVSLGVKTPLARWRWLTDTRPDLLTGGRVWLGAPDLVTAALIGEPVTDLTLAGRTGGVDVRAGRWHPDLLAAAGVDAARLPRIVPPGQPAGRCGTDAARSAGLRPGTPVVVAGHDHLVAGYAAGVRRSGERMDSMGTAEAVFTLAADIPADLPPGTGASWNRFVDGTHYCLISGFPGSGRLVDWFTTRFLGLSGDAGHARFEALADSVERRPTGIVVEPYLSGRAAPVPDPGRGLSLHGVRSRHTAADLALALLEGACAQARWMAEEHRRLLDTASAAGSSVTAGLLRTVVAGGPTRSRAWMRVKAAVTPGDLRVVDDPDAVCAGAALLAAQAGLGVPAAALAVSPVTPDEPERERYEHFYRDWFLPVVTAPGPRPDDPWESP
jgi:xylulokinase